ncbi:MAG: phage holin family protein [Aurantimicrobium sp.]|nr:phage holin family protein [Aurantimicrobium sp.]
MRRFLLSTIINAIALWVTTAVGIGVTLIANREPLTAGGGDLWGFVLTLVVTAAVFGLVNGTIGTVVRIIAFPLYILTLGILALVVNALLLLFVSWLSSLVGFGLHVDGFWSGFWGAIILGIISWLLGLLLRPIRR